jgi:hypothetical protein
LCHQGLNIFNYKYFKEIEILILKMLTKSLQIKKNAIINIYFRKEIKLWSIEIIIYLAENLKLAKKCIIFMLEKQMEVVLFLILQENEEKMKQ